MTPVSPRGWTTIAANVYARPLVGSEATFDTIALVADGCNEQCMGISFRCDYPDQRLISAFREALGRLRFYAPLLAATIRASEDNPGERVWVYRPASSASEVFTWVEQTLLIHTHASTDEDFISMTNQTRLPYIHSDSRSQHLGCHLLLREGGSHSFFVHSTHAVFDGIPVLNAFYCLLKSVTDCLSSEAPAEVPVEDLAWGSEWVNLPVDPVTACGGPHPGWEVELPLLRKQVANVLNRSKPSAGLHPQRVNIQCPGLPVRAHRVLDACITQRLLVAVKKHGLNLTVLFEAAEALVILARNNALCKLDDDTHVTLDMSIISLERFFVPPYNIRTHMSSAMAFVPLVVPFKDIPLEVPKREQLLSVMHSLKGQYQNWLANPHLPHLGEYTHDGAHRSPYSTLITNIGKIERTLPLKWPLGSTRPDLEVTGLPFGFRPTMATRPVTHIWSLGDVIHFQAQASDIWDQGYLKNFLDEVVVVALNVIDGE